MILLQKALKELKIQIFNYVFKIITSIYSKYLRNKNIFVNNKVKFAIIIIAHHVPKNT